MPNRTLKQYYTEAEAAQALGISLERLYHLLDQYVFNEGGPRPSDIEFADSDLLLLNYWNQGSDSVVSKKRGTLIQMRKLR